MCIRDRLDNGCLVVGCVGGWGGDSFTVCCFPVVARVCVWLVVVLGFLLAAHAGALILVCLVVCVRVLCENSIVCQCTFVLVAAGATVLWWLL